MCRTACFFSPFSSVGSDNRKFPDQPFLSVVYAPYIGRSPSLPGYSRQLVEAVYRFPKKYTNDIIKLLITI